MDVEGAVGTCRTGYIFEPDVRVHGQHAVFERLTTVYPDIGAIGSAIDTRTACDEMVIVVNVVCIATLAGIDLIIRHVLNVPRNIAKPVYIRNAAVIIAAEIKWSVGDDIVVVVVIRAVNNVITIIGNAVVPENIVGKG